MPLIIGAAYGIYQRKKVKTGRVPQKRNKFFRVKEEFFSKR